MVIIYGHRGAAGEAPENTVTGFTYARSIGVRDYELDIRLTRDGQVAVIHDETVARTTGASGTVEGLSMEGLRMLKARAGFPEWPERATIPTLDEVFEVIGDGRSFQVEIKRTTFNNYPPLITRMIETITRHRLEERVYVSSFDPLALRMTRQIAPELKRNFITDKITETYIQTARVLGCAMASPKYQSCSKVMIERLHAAGLQVCGWLGNDAKEIETMLQWGVDAITTDYPSLALSHPGVSTG